MHALSSEAANPPQTAFACARAAEHVSQLVISIPLSLSWKFLSSRCGAALKPLFLAAQPSADRKTFSFASFGRRRRTGVERASHKIGIPETFLGFCALGRSVAHWASQMGRER